MSEPAHGSTQRAAEQHSVLSAIQANRTLMHGCKGFVAVCTETMCTAAEAKTAEASTKDFKAQLMADMN